MNDDLFVNIFRKKSLEELENILTSDQSPETRLTVYQILEERKELKKEYFKLKTELTQLINNELQRGHTDKRYKTFWRRFFASWIDSFILYIIHYLITIIITTSDYIMNDIGFLFLALLPFAYSMIFHGYYGQTFGKMVMKVKLYNKDEIHDVKFIQAFYRELIPIIIIVLSYGLNFIEINLDNIYFMTYMGIVASISLIWYLLEIFTMLFNTKRRALHDFIAGTVVLNISE